MTKKIAALIITFLVLLLLLALQPAEAQNKDLQLYATKVEMNGEITFTVYQMQGSAQKFFLYRAKAPFIESDFALVDSSSEKVFKHTAPAPAPGENVKYGFFVTGRNSNNSISRSEVVTIQISAPPVMSAFRLDANVDGDKVNLKWEKPYNVNVLEYGVYRVTMPGMLTVIPTDTVFLGSTTNQYFTDMPPVTAGVTKYYGYRVYAKTYANTVLMSAPAVVAITGKILRDEVKITSVPPLTAQIGKEYTYEVKAVSSDPSAALIYSYVVEFKNQNSNVVMSGNENVVKFTPTAKGWAVVHINVKSDKGGIAKQDFQVIISGGNGVLRGKVTDTLENPLRKVLIEAFKRDKASSFMYKTITDSLGNYLIKNLDPGSYIIHAIPTQHDLIDQWWDGKRTAVEATPITVADSPSEAIANFKLRSRNLEALKATISGTVSDANGLALGLKGTQVTLVNIDFALNSNANFRMIFDFDKNGDPRLDGTSKLVFKAKVDSLGKYSIKIPRGQYIAFAQSSGFSVEYYNEQSELLSANPIRLQSDTSGINFTLSPLPPVLLGSISGQVIDSVKNIGVRARMIAFRDRWIPNVKDSVKFNKSYVVDTDSLGAYTFENLLPGKYFVLAVPLGSYAPVFYSSGEQSIRWKNATRIEINGNSVTGINLYVKPMPDSGRGFTFINGKIQGKSGNTIAPIGGAMAFARYTNGDVAGYASTDLNGNYAITGLAPGKYSVTVDAVGFTSTSDQTASPTYSDIGIAQGAIVNYTIDNVTGVVQNTSTAAPKQFSLSQNYPNPFNPSATIKYAINVSGLTTLKVYDILGKEVATLVNGVQNAGEYAVLFNASQLSSGVYFYTLQSGNTVVTKKMSLLK